MKIMVAVKRVADFNAKVPVKADGSGVDLSNVKMAMNPFDEIAVEAALRLKEAGQASEVVVASIGDPAAAETIRHALAMGADRGILVLAPGRVEPLAVAKALRSLIDRERAELAILGKQAIDDDANQTGQMLSALLDWPVAAFASNILLEDRAVTVVRETDSGHETLRLSLPAVITTDLRLNEPRYASLPNIMKAKRKPVEELTAEQIGVDLRPRLTVLRTVTPVQSRRGMRLGSVSELLDRLKNEARVL